MEKRHACGIAREQSVAMKPEVHVLARARGPARVWGDGSWSASGRGAAARGARSRGAASEKNADQCREHPAMYGEGCHRFQWLLVEPNEHVFRVPGQVAETGRPHGARTWVEVLHHVRPSRLGNLTGDAEHML